jgi:hypothetical protein
MTEPPPTATMASKSMVLAKAMASLKLDADAVEEGVGHFGVVERLLDRGHWREDAHQRIGDDEGVADAQFGQIHANFAGDAGAEADGAGGHFKGGFVTRHTGCSWEF